MNIEFKRGDRVKIISMSPDSAHYHRRESLLGQVGTLVESVEIDKEKEVQVLRSLLTKEAVYAGVNLELRDYVMSLGAPSKYYDFLEDQECVKDGDCGTVSYDTITHINVDEIRYRLEEIGSTVLPKEKEIEVLRWMERNRDGGWSHPTLQCEVVKWCSIHYEQYKAWNHPTETGEKLYSEYRYEDPPPRGERIRVENVEARLRELGAHVNVATAIQRIISRIEDDFFHSETMGYKPADVTQALCMIMLSKTRHGYFNPYEIASAKIEDIRAKTLPRDVEFQLCESLRVQYAFHNRNQLQIHLGVRVDSSDEKTLKACQEQLEWLKSTTRVPDRSGDDLIAQFRGDLNPMMGGHPKE